MIAGPATEHEAMAKSPGKAKAAAKPRASRKKAAAAPGSRGLTAAQVGEPAPEHLAELQGQIVADGGRVLAAYRDPLGGNWQVLAALPLDKAQPTPYQRDLSE